MLHVRKHLTLASCLPIAKVTPGSDEPEPRLRPYFWQGAGKRGLPVGAGRPTGEDLSSVEPLRGRGKRDLAPQSSVLYNTERVCKPGLLVVEATVKGFDKPWTILIDSGASGSYARRCSLEGSQQYAEALKAIVTRLSLSVWRQGHVSPCQRFL